MRLGTSVILLTLNILPLAACDNFSPLYLPNDVLERLVLTPFAPTVVCFKRPPWFVWVFNAFHYQSIIINITSQGAYPFHVFIAASESDLRSRAPWRQSSFPSVLPSFLKFFYLNPDPTHFELNENSSIELFGFESHCVAFISQPGEAYHSAQVNVRFEAHVDWLRISRLFIGLVLYFMSSIISKNIAFYYVAGVSVSVMGSFLILIIIAIRLLPRRTALILQGAFLFGGGAFSFLLYSLNYFRSRLWAFVSDNSTWVLCYFMGVTLISGCVLYWFSLPERLLTNFARTQTLLKLFICAFGVLLISSAPHLPSQLPIITDLINLTAYWAEAWLNVDRSVFLTASPLLMRAAFAGLVLSIVSFISSYTENTRRRRTWRRPMRDECQLSMPPCATSSPYSRRSMKPVWHPLGSGFHDTSSTTSYGGYSYRLRDLELEHGEYTNGCTQCYLGGSGYVISPVPSRVRSNRSTPKQYTTASSRSPKRRSQVGWVVMEDTVFTDDDDEEEGN